MNVDEYERLVSAAILNDPNIELIDGHHFDPASKRYRPSQLFKPGHSVPVVIDGVVAGQIAVDEVLP